MMRENVADRIKRLRLANDLTIRATAKHLGISYNTYAGYEYHKNRKIPNSILHKLANLYHTTLDYITHGIEMNSQANSPSPLIIYVEKDTLRERIAYVPIAAQAGYVKHYNEISYLKELATYSLPGFTNGTFRMFPVEGDSMIPTYLPGDILICESIESYTDLKDGECYVIVSQEGICIKRCINAVKKRGAIIIESDNTEYKLDLIPIESVLEIWRPKARITKN